MKFGIFFFSLLLSGSIATAQDPAPRSVPVELAPVPVAEGVSIQRFADSSLIKQPTGLAITQSGKLLAVQSNTHFRPDDYEGVETDQIFWIQDTDGDGIADQKSVFYQNELVATMDIAVHPESGAIYVATRNEIIRLWDDNNDGVADPDRVERRIVFLETEGNYPHNGISGLTFDDLGTGRWKFFATFCDRVLESIWRRSRPRRIYFCNRQRPKFPPAKSPPLRHLRR
jgi:glucose/arabinose dehydrogenase